MGRPYIVLSDLTTFTHKGATSLEIEGITGTFIPIAILFFALSFIFYMGFIKIKNEIVNYKEYLTLLLRNQDDIQLYIDELKNTMKK